MSYTSRMGIAVRKKLPGKPHPRFRTLYCQIHPVGALATCPRTGGLFCPECYLRKRPGGSCGCPSCGGREQPLAPPKRAVKMSRTRAAREQ